MNPIILLPTYNEAENLSKMIKTIFEDIFNNQKMSVLVVDGNSPDGTAQITEELQKIYPNLYLIKQKNKNGLAKAYLEGFNWCIAHDFNIFIQMDCDFQHPVEVLPQMLDKINQYDVVIGSRYIKGGGWDKNNIDLRKQFTSKLGSFYAKIVLQCNINDLTGGFNIYTKQALEKININKIISRGYCFQIEMKYYAYKSGLKIIEFPIIFKPRYKGVSKMDFNIIFESIIKILKIKIHNF